MLCGSKVAVSTMLWSLFTVVVKFVGPSSTPIDSTIFHLLSTKSESLNTIKFKIFCATKVWIG